jgi:enamine deaminase RidA (YjgF/YER057c/UK114 family)
MMKPSALRSPSLAPDVSTAARLSQLGIRLPKPWAVTPTAEAAFVRVIGRRVMVSGHLPIDDEGRVCGPFGRIGAEVSEDAGVRAAERAMLAIFASLVREIGSLDRIGAWIQLFGMVCADPSFKAYPKVIDGASRLVNQVFGREVGKHSRVAVAVAGLPFNAPVEVQAELELLPDA